ncbi:unnamed protein product [Penicillium manginii]
MARNLNDIKIVPDPDIHHPESGSYEADDWQSETTSVASDLYRGFLENGRRYQTLRNAEYFSPADEQQFETYEVGHLAALLMNSDKANPLYCAPIKEPMHVLDVGTGQGAWAIDVADLFNARVRGVDLFPPPNSWIPPNCIFEVDDVLKQWTWHEKFDLIHLRHGIGGFSSDEWAFLYKQCYENLEPGGWFEQIEMDIRCECDDGSIPADTSRTTMKIIDKEFERLKNMRENRLNNDIMNYLDETHNKIQFRGICNPRGPHKKSLIHSAAMGDCTALLQSLLEIGYPVDDLDQNKRTPLSWAAENGSLGATKLLLKNGAKVNSLDDMYGSPLSWLDQAGDPKDKALQATRTYLKNNGATMKGAKRAWILNKLGLL